MKVGDLVKHREDDVLGLIVGQTPVYLGRFRLIVQWFDTSGVNEESPKWLVLVNESR